MTDSDFSWEAAERRGTGSCKWDDAPALYGSPDVLPLWVADMDFPAPPAVLDALHRQLEHGVLGYPSARQDGALAAISGWFSRRFAWEVPTSDIVLAPGVVPSLKAALDVFTQPGDGVIVQTPVYHPFLDLARSHGRTLIENALIERDGNWQLDLEGLETAAQHAKALILCSPHNPVGRAWSREELAAISKICSRHDVLVLSDEIHADLVHRPHRHVPFATVGGSAAAKAMTFVAPSKTFNIAGLNASAVVIADPAARKAFTGRFRDLGVSRTSATGIVATQAAYAHGEAWLESLLVHLAENSVWLEETVRTRLSPLKLRRPEATYLAWIDCRALGLDDAGLKRFFSHEAKVGLNHGAMFGKPGSGWMRLNFGTSRAILEEAVDRIEAALRHRGS
jgi:cysteine-S-conjugate beta-lyase